MNDINKNDGAAENPPTTAADDAELRALDERLAELRAKGIISGGEGPRESLKPVAHIPGALERFLKNRG